MAKKRQERGQGGPDGTRLGRAAFLAAATKGEPLQDARLTKAFVADEIKQLPGEDGQPSRRVRFVISTSAVDRENDMIDPAGWELANYLRNPAVMFGHDYYSPPIARTVAIAVEEERLVADAEFAPADVNPFADTIFRAVVGGWIKGASVGFRPLEWTFDEERKGFSFTRQELLEWSIVSIPSNAEALVAMRAAGLDGPVREWAERTLKMLDREQTPANVVIGTPDLTMSTTTTTISSTNPTTFWQSELKVVPRNVSEELAADDTPWQAPTLGDFTDEAWDDLSDDDKRKIAGHFAWAREMPPAAFGSLKLPHHRPSDGRVVFRGVAAAMAALLGARGGVDVPGTERRAIYSHLAVHYEAFGRTPPEFRDYESALPEEVDLALHDAARLYREAHGITAKPINIEVGMAVKFNPAALPLEGSFEWRTGQLTGKLRAYLSLVGVTVRPQEDRPFVVATFEDRAVVVVMGADRPWEDDPTYAISYEVVNGSPEWRGAPRPVDVRVQSEIVYLMARSYGEDKTAFKSGRVLAQRNLDRLKSACESIQMVITEEEARGRPDGEREDQREEAQPPAETKEAKPDGLWLELTDVPAVPAKAVMFELVETPTEMIVVDPEAIQAAVRAVAGEAVTGQMRRFLNDALMGVTGRVD